jgi:hypothetical protein
MTKEEAIKEVYKTIQDISKIAAENKFYFFCFVMNPESGLTHLEQVMPKSAKYILAKRIVLLHEEELLNEERKNSNVSYLSPIQKI